MYDHAFSSRQVPELPSLEPGVRLLEVDGGARGPLHALVVDHVLTAHGRAYWIDTGGHATTRPLAQLAPGPGVLDRIRVARAFTPYQHYSLLETLRERVDEDTALVVVPALDGLYRSDDLDRDEREELLVRALAVLARCGRDHGVAILVTRTRDDAVSAPIAATAAEVLRCEETRHGPRFVADEFETLVYPTTRGYLQTTLAFWHRIIEARRPLYDRTATDTLAAPSREVVIDGAH